MLAAKGGYIDTVEAILQEKLPSEILNAVAGFVSDFQHETSY